MVDVGGTHCRVARADADGVAIELRQLEVFPTPRDSLLPMLNNYGLANATRIAVAAAGRIHFKGRDARVQLTNTGLRLSQASLAQLVPHGAVLVNDLVAVAAAVPRLTAIDSRPVCGPEARPDKAVVVAGVGTGFGAALLTDDGRVIGTEAGHADLAPGSAAEAALLSGLGPARQSVESLLSGPGLLRLYQAVAGRPCDSVGELLELAEQGNKKSRTTLNIFSRWLGRVAGNLVLSSGAWGGVYLVGGVIAGLGPWLDRAPFAEGFCDKHPFGSELAQVPVRHIVHEQPALIGLAEICKNQ